MKHRFFRVRPRLFIAASTLLGLGIGAVFAVGILGNPESAGSVPADSPEPRLRLSKTAKDFGVVLPGAMLSTSFVLHNDGGTPLIISNLDTSCGCTPAEITRETIPPGETSEIRVESRVPSHPGMVSHAIFFETNDPSHKKVSLPLSAKAAWPISADPVKVHLPSIPVGTESTRPLELFESASSMNDSKIRVEKIETSAPWVDVVLKESDSRRLRYEVLVTPPELGRIAEWASFRTGNENRPTIMVPIEGNAVGPISLRPPVLVLGNMTPGSRKELSLKVESNFDQLELISIEVGDSHWAVQKPKFNRSGSDQNAVVTLSLEIPEMPGFHQTKLSVRFAQHEQPVKVPVSVYVTEDRS